MRLRWSSRKQPRSRLVTMPTPGVRTPGVGMVTSRLLGCFLDDQRSRKEVLALMGY